MAIAKRQNYRPYPPAQQGELSSLLRSYGSIGGASRAVMDLSKDQAMQAGKAGMPLLVARIYAPTPVRNVTLTPAFEANDASGAESMIDRIYQLKR